MGVWLPRSGFGDLGEWRDEGPWLLTENQRWGYRRIQGEPSNARDRGVGHGDQKSARRSRPQAGPRHGTTTWRRFLLWGVVLGVAVWHYQHIMKRRGIWMLP
jgi:hypothetical protein